MPQIVKTFRSGRCQAVSFRYPFRKTGGKFGFFYNFHDKLFLAAIVYVGFFLVHDFNSCQLFVPYPRELPVHLSCLKSEKPFPPFTTLLSSLNANGYVYETFGISKHIRIKLQLLLIRAGTFDNPLTAKCFIYDVMPRNLSFFNHLTQITFCFAVSAYEIQPSI